MEYDIVPLMLMIHHFILILMNMRVLQQDDDAFSLLILLNQCLDILCSVRLQSPLSVPVSLRPIDLDNHLVWEGRDVYSILVHRRDHFWYMTSETPETFNQLLHKVTHNLQVHRSGRLSPRNRLLLTLIWLRQYPTLSILSLIFDAPIMTISRIVEDMWIALWHTLTPEIKSPTTVDWRQKCGNWPEMPRVVGAIDATSHEILIPENDQQMYFSGHRHYHCFHTQIVIDNSKNICYVHSGFYGHQNDAVTFQRIPNIGPGLQLDFPNDARLLADSIYPCQYPLLTAFRSNAITNQTQQEQRYRRKFNRLPRARRVYVEHVIKDIKSFKSISSIYRHQRHFLPCIVELCAALAKRKMDLIASC